MCSILQMLVFNACFQSLVSIFGFNPCLQSLCPILVCNPFCLSTQAINWRDHSECFLPMLYSCSVAMLHCVRFGRRRGKGRIDVSENGGVVSHVHLFYIFHTFHIPILFVLFQVGKSEHWKKIVLILFTFFPVLLFQKYFLGGTRTTWKNCTKVWNSWTTTRAGCAAEIWKETRSRGLATVSVVTVE